VDLIKRNARRAGWLYLSLLVLGPFSLIYVPSKLIVSGDATATAGKILASERLFRLGIATGLAGDALFLLVALALYRLFAEVGKHQAVLMAALAIVAVPIGFVNRINQIAALHLFKGADFLSVVDPAQRDALGMLFLRLYSNGILVASVFWGLWLLPFGLLVWRSGFLPRVLGVLLVVAGVGYVLSSFGTLVFPESREAIGRVATFTNFGELPIIFWLAFGAIRSRGPVDAGA
jgi:hypothetical protein